MFLMLVLLLILTTNTRLNFHLTVNHHILFFYFYLDLHGKRKLVVCSYARTGCFPHWYETILALRKAKKMLSNGHFGCSMISWCQSHKINRNVDVKVSYSCPKCCSIGQIGLCVLCEQAYYRGFIVFNIKFILSIFSA